MYMYVCMYTLVLSPWCALQVDALWEELHRRHRTLGQRFRFVHGTPAVQIRHLTPAQHPRLVPAFNRARDKAWNDSFGFVGRCVYHGSHCA